MKTLEDLKAALAAATPGGLYPSVEEVRLLCGTPDFTLYSQLLEHAPALIECVEALREMERLLYEATGLDDTTRTGQVMLKARTALAKLENVR